MAGLLASRVLAEHFRNVTVCEKDPYPADCTPRPGAPQGRHLHILLPSGVQALENLFPGRIDELVRDGANRFDYGQSQLYVYGTWLPRVETELMALAQTRPFLEQHLRRWIGEIPDAEVIYEASVDAPVPDRSKSSVIGIDFSVKGQVQ